ncbi:hypothetical protein EV651_101232 [Kribbella sp. VKM Ac-2571]|uniref:DUF6879 family protein n=1 Tax=Kribbella sp. VKM Ac-2571 TaxID=2512222 RepID=UPI001060E572|nr:DUF6879 family protein [Kribbella sp. VKM Ac-2571]TDO69192.1 hypothetical protein EV651_101232 [Kribbella sp. VKM Ac-2571]
MQEITETDLTELTGSFRRSMVHLETRDAYGTETELPYMAKWKRGEPDDYDWLEDWCQKIRDHVNAGRTARRVKIVSEPLSDYQRWAYEVFTPIARAGEDVRWMPRRSVSTICIPGNDYYLFDDERVVFLHYAGSGLNTAYTMTTDADVVEMCSAAFEKVWELSVPHSEYKSA